MKLPVNNRPRADEKELFFVVYTTAEKSNSEYVLFSFFKKANTSFSTRPTLPMFRHEYSELVLDYTAEKGVKHNALIK